MRKTHKKKPGNFCLMETKQKSVGDLQTDKNNNFA